MTGLEFGIRICIICDWTVDFFLFLCLFLFALEKKDLHLFLTGAHVPDLLQSWC